MRALLPLLLLSVLPPVQALQAERPRLGIESGFHQAPVADVDATADGSLLVSCSDDRTLRLWRFEEGALVAADVLRPPVGEGNEGKLYACAVRDDGGLVATGGWTSAGEPGTASVYLIDPRAGRMAGRVAGLPQVVLALEFEPGGERLLVGLAGGEGLRCHGSDGRELWRDEEYAGAVYGVAWLEDGGCVAVGLDGGLRRYARDGRRLAAVRAGGGSQPMAVASNGAGELLVGYADVPRLDRIGLADLSLLGSLDLPRGAETTTFTSVAWSDGHWWAGGVDQVRRGGHLGCWDAAGRPLHGRGARDIVLDVAALPGGRVLVGGGEPALRVADPSGLVLAEREGASCELTSKRYGYLQADGELRRLWFGRGPEDEEPASFDLPGGDYAPAGVPGLTLWPPRHDVEAVAVEGWKGTSQVRVGGRAVDLDPGDTAHVAVVLWDDERVALGSDFALTLLSAEGEVRWSREVPAACFGLHGSRDDRLLLAAHADGTFRWHRTSDGEELLALFPHRNGRDWVAWTPSGHYDCSPGGESLIGWHVGRGADALADFFPAGRFRERYHRPGVVRAVLETLDVEEAVRRAGSRLALLELPPLPPIVRLLEPRPGSRVPRRLELGLRIDSEEPLEELRVLADGEVLARSRGLSVEPAEDATPGELRRLAVELPAHLAGREVTLAVLATSAAGASEPALVRVRVEDAAEAPVDPLTRPVCYVLAIGVGDYERDELDLPLAAKDARDLAAALATQRGRLYRDVRVRLLEDATRGEVVEGLEWLEREATARDLAVLFLAGHGVDDERQRYCFLPADADPERLRSTAVLHTELLATIGALSCKTVAFLDTCHAGNVTGGRRRAGDPASSLTHVLLELSSAENGSVVFASATGNQYALEDERWGNGAFTAALVEALTGSAEDLGDEFLEAILERPTLTVNLLNTYLAERVKQLTGGRQTPTMERPATVPDFPLALR